VYGKGWPPSPQSLNRTRHTWPFYALWAGHLSKRPYGRFSGGPPAGQEACIHLLSLWTPHAVRLWILQTHFRFSPLFYFPLKNWIWVPFISIWRWVSPRVKDGQRLATLWVSHPHNDHIGVSGVAHPQGVERLGMAGPSDTLGNPWPPLAIHPCLSSLGSVGFQKDSVAWSQIFLILLLFGQKEEASFGACPVLKPSDPVTSFDMLQRYASKPHNLNLVLDRFCSKWNFGWRRMRNISQKLKEQLYTQYYTHNIGI
jgi:hypothetical protein